MTAHNHDLDPSCPETVTPDGTVRGACMDQAQIVSTGNERDDRITITVEGENLFVRHVTVRVEMDHACGQTHLFVDRDVPSGWPELTDRACAKARAAVLRAAKDCEMGTGQ